LLRFAEIAIPCRNKAENASKILTFFRMRWIIQKTQKEAPMDKRAELLRSLKFLLFSVSAGVIELVSFALLNETLGWPYWPCYLIALVLSVLWNFTLNRRYTFRSANNVPVAMAKVFLFYLIFTPTSTIFGNWLAEGLHWNEYLVTGINMVLNFVLEFLYDRFFVFRDSIDTNSLAKKQDARN
jgi:putative flippase GtrA